MDRTGICHSGALYKGVPIMKVSILISTYNGMDDLPLLMESIEKLELGRHEMEVILRDDNSTDGTADKAEQNYPWVTLIRGRRNVGFVKSNNIAFRHAAGDIICCVNQDTVLDKRFLIEGLNIFANRPLVVGINTNMIMPWVLTWNEFRKISRDDCPSYEYQLTSDGFAKYVPVEANMRETSFLTGGGFFLRRSVLEKEEELFDSRIHMYCEDTELTLRLKRRGGVLIYAPGAVIYHSQIPKEADSINDLIRLIKITWNRFYVLSKHSSPSDFLKNYPLYIFGIIRKMDYLGLRPSKKRLAYSVGGCLALPFFCLLPYWLWHSMAQRRRGFRHERPA